VARRYKRERAAAARRWHWLVTNAFFGDTVGTDLHKLMWKWLMEESSKDGGLSNNLTKQRIKTHLRVQLPQPADGECAVAVAHHQSALQAMRCQQRGHRIRQLVDRLYTELCSNDRQSLNLTCAYMCYPTYRRCATCSAATTCASCK